MIDMKKKNNKVVKPQEPRPSGESERLLTEGLTTDRPTPKPPKKKPT